MSTSKEILTRIETKLDSLSRDIMKVIYSLIGVVAASVGLKFIGSPIHVIISSYIATFASFFIIASVAHRWKFLPPIKKATRLMFSGYILFSVYCRHFVIYQPPEWFAISLNVIFTILSILLVISIWKDKGGSDGEI